MKNVRVVLFAALCAALLPHLASANTLNSGDRVTVDFVIPTGTYQSLGLDVGAFDGTLTVDFASLPSPNPLLGTGALLPTYVFNTDFTGGTVYASVSYVGTGTYDTTGLGMYGYSGPNGQGFSTGLQPDAVSPTPLPASLSLFLAGAAVFFGLFLSRGLSRSQKFAT